MKVNNGTTLLIPRDQWVSPREIQGSDITVINSPVMNKAGKKILELHQKKHEIAFCSLCTQTRPYSKGRKWKLYKNLFSKYCDLIVTSNGGIIPLEFETCYPYMTYDAHGEKENNDPYVHEMIKRMKVFFKKHRYTYILFNYRHNLRNVLAGTKAGEWLKQKEYITDFKILPTKYHYELSRCQSFTSKGYSYYPELFPTMLLPVLEQIKIWNKILLKYKGKNK